MDRTNRPMSEKLSFAAPYNIFFNVIPAIPETYLQYNAISFRDLLCPSLGILKTSLHLTFTVEFDWVLDEYERCRVGEIPITILYGDRKVRPVRLRPRNTRFYLTHRMIQLHRHGKHNSKLTILVYSDDSIRVVVSTVNLTPRDWDRHNHTFWISPRCPALPAGCAEGAGESLTKFKASLLNYLCQYTNPDIITWIEIVRKVDFSTVRVFLVETIPGTHSAQNNKTHCTRIEQLILEHRNAPLYQPWHFPGARKHGIIVAQLNSIEVFPDDPPKWFYNDVWTPLYGGEARRNEPVLHIIYPTVDNVRFGAYRRSGARCLSCSRDFLDENPWLRPYLRRWQAETWMRTSIMPRTTQYCHASPDFTELDWFFFTSASLSWTAWGQRIVQNNRTVVQTKNFELGVMFFPRFFDEYSFQTNLTHGSHRRLFPLLFDVPTVHYTDMDIAWTNVEF